MSWSNFGLSSSSSSIIAFIISERFLFVSFLIFGGWISSISSSSSSSSSSSYLLASWIFSENLSTNSAGFIPNVKIVSSTLIPIRITYDATPTTLYKGTATIAPSAPPPLSFSPYSYALLTASPNSPLMLI